jgi:transglutaminase/protease-like cytokinesis protein 3
MKKRIFASWAAVLIFIAMMSLTVSAATPTMTGTLSKGTLVITVTGLGSNIVQVNFLATDNNDPTNLNKDRFDTAVVSKGTATFTFTGLTGTDYIVNATPKASDATDGDAITSIEVKDAAAVPIGVTYSAHVQKIGWQPYVNNGAEAGTDGKGLRVEAIKINLTGTVPTGAKITYKAQVQSKGWMNCVTNGAEAGTDGKSLRVEALKITLSGMPGYGVEYRAHVQKVGWQGWQTTKNGTNVDSAALAGTVGKALRVEAIEIKIVKVS